MIKSQLLGVKSCVQLGKCRLKNCLTSFLGRNLYCSHLLQALRTAASWQWLTPFLRIPYQLFLVPDFYGCFGINSIKLIYESSQVLYLCSILWFLKEGTMTILKPERSHCYINWMRLEIELPPIGVVSYQAFQRVARGVLNFETRPRLVFPTSRWLFSLACWSQLSWKLLLAWSGADPEKVILYLSSLLSQLWMIMELQERTNHSMQKLVLEGPSFHFRQYKRKEEGFFTKDPAINWMIATRSILTPSSFYLVLQVVTSPWPGEINQSVPV